ncbi:hypothetical protein [Flavonifractor sp. An9]|uniref:hypothetical protein n=1 Tax=Flavonifractor sp. An9 TaxID=1965664 RepID=UPI000B36ABF3|nr:hypothetical protein [Flavonifractor sp. An9]OUN11392.1 hypothetical protein B5G40_07130 [Flavonifractor sp. An9]
MRQYVNLLMVAARSRLWQVILITAGTSAAQVALAISMLNKVSLYGFMQNSLFHLLFTAGLVLICLSLASFGMERGGSKLGYTLRRLPCGEERATLIFALHHFLCLLIYWGGQIAAAWYIALRFCALSDDAFPMLVFYYSGWFHGILPGLDWPIYIRNVVMLTALAMAAATCSYHWRRGDKPFTVVPLAAFAGLSFPADAGAFGLPGPGSDFVASLPNVYAKVPDNIMVALFQLAVFVTALIIVTYNLIGRARYVDT